MAEDSAPLTGTARAAGRRVRGRPRRHAVVLVVAGTLLAACSSAAAPSTPSTDSTFTAGVAAQAHGDHALAVADFLAVVKRDPRNKFAWYDLGDIADQAGQQVQAAGDYRRSLGIDPNYVPALFNLAVLETAGAPTAAATLYTQVLRVAPGDADAHLNLGFVLRSLGQTAAGDRQIATALRLDPSLAGRIPTGVPTGS